MVNCHLLWPLVTHRKGHCRGPSLLLASPWPGDMKQTSFLPSHSVCLSVCFSLPFLLSLFSTPLHHRPYSLSSPVSSPSPFAHPHWGSAQRAGAEVRLGVSRAGRAPPPPPPAWGLGHPREHKGGHLHSGLQDLEEDKGMSPEFRGARGAEYLLLPGSSSHWGLRGTADGNGASDRCQ